MRFLALLLLLPTLSHADDWTREDTYRQTALTVLLVADWAQTSWAIKKNENHCSYPEPCRSYEEGNPLLGTHPSIGKLNILVGTGIIGHAAVARILPRELREGWQYVWIGIETNAVYRNHQVGIKFHF